MNDRKKSFHCEKTIARFFCCYTSILYDNVQGMQCTHIIHSNTTFLYRKHIIWYESPSQIIIFAHAPQSVRNLIVRHLALSSSIFFSIRSFPFQSYRKNKKKIRKKVRRAHIFIGFIWMATRIQLKRRMWKSKFCLNLLEKKFRIFLSIDLSYNILFCA